MSELTDQETADRNAVDAAQTDVTEAPESTDATDTTDLEVSQEAPEGDDAENNDDVEGRGAENTAGRAVTTPDAPADLEKEGEVAADFLENLLDICDLDGDIDVDIDGDRAAVAIVDSEEGRVPRRLVGDNAKVLDALQELTRLAVQAATGHRSRLMLDVAGHRAGRRAELVEVAKVAIASVKESGEQTALDPMTAFERKVVHDEVLAAGLSSESEGVEPRRHVVVLPA
ncbi:R3H domain-containing nucleic acid-binding protein [Knoellia sp. S7-12]|uniref:Jag family protein n=1 Tax=Knoellia sp. S7-12 TaxID=3126698 RepID=UPI0033669B3F